MGIQNATPDSFFDGGRHNGLEAGIRHMEEMAESGADIIDIGGESTRPGSQSVSEEEEISRVIPFCREAVKRFSLPVSIDTCKSRVARAALDAGAVIVNDVSGMTADPHMAELCSLNNASVVICHIQGTPETMQRNPEYHNVVSEVMSFLKTQTVMLESKGLSKSMIAVDPGIGFGKTLEHNYQLIAQLDKLGSLGYPILMGMSRKSFIGMTKGLETSDRLQPSIGAAVLAALKGAAILRTHDVKATWEQLRIIEAVLEM